MVVLNRIYTGQGDRGDTALGSGVRVAKTSARVEAYGTVDEANAAIGLARSHTAGGAAAELAAALARIQNDLFDLGADLCLPPAGADADRRPRPPKGPALRIARAHWQRLEGEIDAMNASLAPLRSFILPGGSELAAALHLARTVARRAERRCFALAAAEPVGEDALRYLNRLSDWLFVAARIANDCGRADILWQPGAGLAESSAPDRPAGA